MFNTVFVKKEIVDQSVDIGYNLYADLQNLDLI